MTLHFLIIMTYFLMLRILPEVVLTMELLDISLVPLSATSPEFLVIFADATNF